MEKITLNTLPQATEQELFDYIATHLLTQNEKSMSSMGCQYHIKDLKCAAGCLIDRTEYDQNFEGKDWSTLVRDR